MLLPIFSQRMWLPGITRSTPRFNGSLRDWIVNSNWSPEKMVTRRKAILSPHNLDDFVDASFNDAIKLSIASFESASAVNAHHTEARSCAWQLISYYYSAYFAANALMRLTGHGCQNLTPLECAEINEQARIYSLGGTDDGNKIFPGIYYSKLEQTKTPQWIIQSINTKGGVHIQFWNGFIQFLNDIQTSIKTSKVPTIDRKTGTEELHRLIDGLKYGGTQSGAWLSEVRNSINYRFEYGVWHPYQGCETSGTEWKSIFMNTISGLSDTPRTDQTMPDLQRAVRLNATLIGWLKSSLTTLDSASSGRKKSIISNGPLAIASRLSLNP